MKEKIYLTKNWYFTQRNNQLRPSSACNVTSMIMAAVVAGYKDIIGSLVNEGTQWEDSFMTFINYKSKFTKEWKEKNKDWLIQSNKGYLLSQPELVMEVLANSFSEWLGLENIASCHNTLKNGIEYHDFKEYLDSGYGIVLGGDFTKIDGNFDHYVILIGYDDNNYYIADPWGDYRTGYSNKKGYKVPLSDRQVRTKIAFCNNTKKMGILIKPLN